MSVEISVLCPNGRAMVKLADHYPDTCPICHHAVEARFIAALAPADEFFRFDIAFKCPRVECGRLFVGRYQTKLGSGAAASLNAAVPVTPTGTRFPEEISGLSPTFVEVYQQAEAAEAGGLDQLTGIGMRKALEFLVKDFALKQSGDQGDTAKDVIRKSWLASVIEDHIDDAKVQAAAKRATWLGNDETHYLRKWENQDITDLKTLIRITVNAVENVLLLDAYQNTMPERPKTA